MEQLLIFDKFSADNTKKFWRRQKKGDGCKVRSHTDLSPKHVRYIFVFIGFVSK